MFISLSKQNCVFYIKTKTYYIHEISNVDRKVYNLSKPSLPSKILSSPCNSVQRMSVPKKRTKTTRKEEGNNSRRTKDDERRKKKNFDRIFRCA